MTVIWKSDVNADIPRDEDDPVPTAVVHCVTYAHGSRRRMFLDIPASEARQRFESDMARRDRFAAFLEGWNARIETIEFFGDEAEMHPEQSDDALFARRLRCADQDAA